MLLAGRAHRQHALGKATACLALRAETALAPEHGRAQRSLSGVVGRLDRLVLQNGSGQSRAPLVSHSGILMYERPS